MRTCSKYYGELQRRQVWLSTHKWLTIDRLPLLSRYNLISSATCNAFQNELSKPDIEIGYMILKGKGAGSSGRRYALCSGIVQAVIDAQSSRTYTDFGGKSITMKKPYTDDLSADGYLRWAISCGLLESHGNSSNPRLPLVVMFEMLASNKAPNAEYLRFQQVTKIRRATRLHISDSRKHPWSRH